MKSEMLLIVKGLNKELQSVREKTIKGIKEKLQSVKDDNECILKEYEDLNDMLLKKLHDHENFNNK